MTDNVLVCQWCNQTFERPNTKGPAPKYCRPSHRQRQAERNKQIKQLIRIEELVNQIAAMQNPTRQDNT